MSDKKISQLPPASTPLTGAEVLPVVQSSVTDQVSVANLTAGRVPAMNNAALGYTATTAAAGTTTLTATSNHIQRLTGSTTQTFKLPDATTMTAGTAFIFDNDSTGLLTVVDNASGAVTTVPSNSIQYVYLMTNATAAGTWGKYSWTYGGGALSITAAKSASITNSLTLSGTDSTTMTFPSTSATMARTDAAQTFSSGNTFGTANTNSQTFCGYIYGRDSTAYPGVGGLGFYALKPVLANANQGGLMIQYQVGAQLNDGLELTYTGDVKAVAGNLVIGTSGKGIDFSATANPGGMTSELLADYEEGTFTPVLKDAAAGNAATAYASQGWYTKIGNRVYIDISLINVNTTGLTAGNQIFITGLPYTHNATSYYTTPSSIIATQLTSTTGSIGGWVDSNTAYMTLYNNTTSNITNLTVGSINSTNTDFYISVNYATT